MDSDFSAKLKSVLSDPEAISKITAIASSMMGGNSADTSAPFQPSAEQQANTQPQAQNPPQMQNGIPSEDNFKNLAALAQGFSPQVDDPRLALLCAIKPLLREDKRDRVDALTRALTVAAMMKNLRK